MKYVLGLLLLAVCFVACTPGSSTSKSPWMELSMAAEAMALIKKLYESYIVDPEKTQSLSNISSTDFRTH